VIEEDEYADLSDEELAELLELEELELEAAGDQELVPDVDVSSGEEVLEDWQETVDDWGGRISSPARKTLLEELGQGQLGQTIFLPTSQTVFLAGSFVTVLLAEVQLSKAVPMDVTFNYTNMAPRQENPNIDPLDQGNGFVRVTWGTPGSFKRTADIDGNRGWRRQFSASFMRVEYVPVDPGNANIIPINQPRDLGVSAQISPAIGSVSEPLTKTVYFGDIPGNSTRFKNIPRWAKTVQMAGSWDDDSAVFDVLMTDSGVLAVQRFNSTGELLLATTAKFPVPQRAQRIFITMGMQSSVNRATAIFELTL